MIFWSFSVEVLESSFSMILRRFRKFWKSIFIMKRLATKLLLGDHNMSQNNLVTAGFNWIKLDRSGANQPLHRNSRFFFRRSVGILFVFTIGSCLWIITVIWNGIGLHDLQYKQTKSSDRNLAQHEIKLEISRDI